MTPRDRMLATIAGRPTDRIPWAPRLDLWYRANRRADTLPPPYQRATLREILEDTGMGRHEYRLRAFGCDGAGTEPLAWMLYYSASDDGWAISPGWQFSYIWQGLFD